MNKEVLMGMQQTRTLQPLNYTIGLVWTFFLLTATPAYTQCGAGDIGGPVYLETPAADASTANVYGVQDANESGIAGIYVAVTDPSGTVLLDTTDASGIWYVTPAAFPVRVEYSWSDSWLETAPNTSPAINTDVQFYTASSCAAGLGVYYPDEYCNMAPDVVTSCFVSGDPLAGGSTGPIDAIVSFQYDWLNDSITPSHDALMSDVGAIWGVAYNNRTQSAFFSALMKRHVGLGPSGIGGIYRIDYSSGTAVVSSFIDLAALGVDVGTEPVRSLSGDYDSPNTDSLMFDTPGKLGMGDMEISDDGNTLFVMNLNSKKVVTIDLTAYNTSGTLPGAAEIDSLPALPFMGCVNGETRPFAIKYRRGKVYVGAVCSAENAGSASDLNAAVFVYDIAGGSWTTAVNSFTLDYTKGGAIDNFCTSWEPWISTYDNISVNCRPTPMLTDIEFDGDDIMILCFADRYTFQKFTLQRNPTDTGSESAITGGDVVRAYYNGANYSVESGGTIPAGGGCGLNGQGIGGGEFYCGDFIGTEHSEIIMGAAAVLRGTGEVMLTTINPVNFNSGGVRRFDNMTGASDTIYGYELYETPGSSFPGGNGYAVKGGGLGDIELLCEEPPIEIFSFIWDDADNDGVQDPDEFGIPNVYVSLFDLSGNLLWVDSTDANGLFAFSDTLEAYTDYYVVIGNDGDFNPADSTLNGSLQLTLDNTGTGTNADKNDSDFTLASGIHASIDGYPFVTVSTDKSGKTFHNFDIGFFGPCVNPDLLTSDTTICASDAVDISGLISDANGTAGTLTFYDTYTDAAAESNAIAALVSPSDTTQYYVRKNTSDPTCFDIDSLTVNANIVPNLLAGDITICSGDTTNIGSNTVESTNEPITLSFFSSFADALAESNALANGVVFPTDTTTYYIRANTVSMPVCADIDSVVVNVDTCLTFDLALLIPDPAGPVDPCDTVSYTMWVYNQGGIAAHNVVVTNYLGAGMNFDASISGNNSWDLVGAHPTDTIAGPIAPGDSVSVSIALVVDCAHPNTSAWNHAEITAYDDDTNNANAGPVDEDSVTDNDSTNDPNVDDDINDNPDNPADDDDHDGAVVAVNQTVSVFDLALRMDTPNNPVDPCDTVIYNITLYNQGTEDAYNMLLANYIADGMSIDLGMPENAGWSVTGNTALTTFVGPIIAGDSIVVNIALIVDCSFTGTSTNSAAEISDYDNDTNVLNVPPNDIDSNEDITVDNDLWVDNEINDNPNDEDDHDYSPIIVNQPSSFDLALLIADPLTVPALPCDTVSYTIWVYNQGTVPVFNAVVTNYLSSAMTYSAALPANSNWGIVGGAVTDTISGPIAAGDSVALTLDLIVKCSFTGYSVVHAAEISSYDDDTDDSNPGPVDEDSVTDAFDTNDAVIDNELFDAPDNPTDDDDHDIATINVNQGFDLAMLLQTPANPVAPCDTVNYTMWVYNQGDVDAFNVVLTNYLSAGMNFDATISGNGNWEMVSGNPTDTLVGPIAAGDSMSLSIALVVDCAYANTSISHAVEISGYDDDTNSANAGPSDEDSVTDTDSTNDLNIDDEINDNPDNPADDDDHDGATIAVTLPMSFDLAMLLQTPANPVAPCDTVNYTMWVYNQGDVDAFNVVLTNYLSAGMNFDATISGNGNWEMVLGNPTDTLVGPIAAGDSMSVSIALVVDCAYANTSISHAVEISGYDDDTNSANAGPSDEDSVTDTDSTNDLNIDDEINDNPDNPADDDDHDGATIAVTLPMSFDLAMLLQTPANPVAPCDTVNYTMWVYNQGDVDAFNVVLTNYLSAGMNFDATISGNGNWEMVSGNPTDTLVGPIAAGDSMSVSIALVVDCAYANTSISHAVEISGYDDDTNSANAGPSDEDSVTDTDSTNDLNIDDEINDNPDNPADDDDHDGATIAVTQANSFDLAMLLQTPANPVAPCDTVNYTMWVYNQGDVDAFNVVLTNYLSAGMNFDATISGNGNWEMVSGNPTDTLVGPIAAGDSMSVSIALVVDCAYANTSISHAVEISGYDDDTNSANAGPSDEDSVTDTDSTNDLNIDDEINDNPDNPADDDDHDGATIAVTLPMSFDLAMLLQTPVNPVAPCDTVNYTMWVYNQGDVDAFNVVLTNYLSAGMNFDATISGNGNWEMVSGNPTDTLVGPIAAGDSMSVSIALVVDCAYANTSISHAVEISGYDDDTNSANAGPSDEDSVTDTDSTNDLNIDDEINDNPDNPADDDDHDGATIAVTQPSNFDLALLMPTPVNPVNPCDTVLYTIWVYNQGAVDAFNISIADYIPSGMTFSTSIPTNTTWALVGGIPVTSIAGPVAAGDSASVSIALIVDCNNTSYSVGNFAEIIDYDDDTDNTNPDPTDEDSVTDFDGTNDPYIDDEINDLPDNPADDDDHDGAVIAINQSFDLALLMQNPLVSINPCDTLTYDFVVYNQGTVPAYDVDITNYTQTGMTFDAALPGNAGWTLMAGLPTYTIPGPIAPGGTATISISLILDCSYVGIAIGNFAEITAYDDDTDNTNPGPTDEDSVTDIDSTNDQNVDDDVNDNPDNPADDDDHDGAIVAVNQGFDLALQMNADNNPAAPCDTVSYTIWVYNQGNTDAFNIALSNYTPMGMSFDNTLTANAGWVSVSGLPTYVLAGPLVGGDSVSVTIALIVDCSFTGASTNNAVEITAYDDDMDNTNPPPADEDSVTDMDSTNDPNIDNEINDFPDNPGDDDDHDGAVVTIIVPPVLTNDTLYYTTPFETTLSNVCVDLLELGSAVDTTYSCGNPANGLLAVSSPSECVNYIPDLGFDGQDTACVVICDALNNCDTTILVITVQPGCNDIVGATTLSDSLLDCTAEADFCFEILPGDMSDYNITDNGVAYSGGIAACDFDTTYVFTYFSIPGNGSGGPYMVDDWTVNGISYTGQVADMQELTDSMNVWDPAGNWMLDVSSNSIRGGLPSNIYNDIDVTQVSTSMSGTIPMNLSLIPNGTQISLGSGAHQIVFMEIATGCEDTVDIMIDCPNCIDIFAGPDTIMASSCDTTASFCTPILLDDIFDYTILDNNAAFTGQIGGCNHDTIILYNYASIPGGGNTGPYDVDSWMVNGFVFSGTFQDIPALVDSMNVWDATGNWMINGSNIEGGNYLNTYADMIISQNGSVVAILNPNIQLIPASAAIFLSTGSHQLIFTDTTTGCVDTAMVQVDCIDCPDWIDDVITLDADDCDGTANLCMGISPNDIALYTISIDGVVVNGSFFGCDNDTMTTYLTIGFNVSGTYDLDSWTVNGMTFSGITFNNAGQLVDSMNVWDPTGGWTVSGLLIVGGDIANNYGNLVVSSFGVVVADATANIQLFPSGTAVALDTGFHQVLIVDNATGCTDSSEVTVNCIPPPPDCDFITMDNAQLNLSGCVGEAELCLDLQPQDLLNYDIFDNGSIYTGSISGCTFDSLVFYDYSFLTGGGNFGPYMLDAWTVNGQFFSGQFGDVDDLVDSLNIWDTSSAWSNDVANSLITGPPAENNYSALEVTHIATSTSVTLPVEYQQFANTTAFGVTSGSHEIVLVDLSVGCADTIDVLVACIDPGTYQDTISVGEVDTLCFDLSELPGVAGAMINFCEDSSGEFAVFEPLGGSYCMEVTGIEVGQDSACIEICDDFGFCDTTWVYVVVNDDSQAPIAWPDVDSTFTNTPVTVTLTNNDVEGLLGIDTVYIVEPPANGSATVDSENGTLTYTPDEGYCNSLVPDTMTYAICNTAGCDTAQVSIYVWCDELSFVSGFSPNGDGVNDYFIIEGLGAFPNNTLTIFNRWGNQVFFSERYQNDWQGTFNYDALNLPDGTYFYVLEDGEGREYSGYIQIHR